MDENRLNDIRRIVEEDFQSFNKDQLRAFREDVRALVSLVDELAKKIVRLEKKNEILQNQNMELTQEMENIRSDFGNHR